MLTTVKTQKLLVRTLDGNADRGLMYAEACFETFRVIGGAVFCWHAHATRLRDGLAAFGLHLDDEVVSQLHAACLQEASRHGPDVLLRLTVTGGDATWGINLPVESTLNAWIQAKPFCGTAHPVRLCAVAWPWPVKSRPAKFTSDYGEALRALQACKGEIEGDEEALFCAGDHVLSTATANMLLYRQGMWWTPRIEMGGILPGVVRSVLLTEGCVKEAVCPLSWLADCAVAAVTNSGSFIRPVSHINDRALELDDALFRPLWDGLAGRPGVPDTIDA